MAEDTEEGTTGRDWTRRLATLRSPSERAVADFLTAIGPRAAAMSAKEIAESTGTSDATVVRTARSLGFGGLRQMKRFLAGRSDDDAPIDERLRVSLDATADPGAELRSSIERQRLALAGMGETVTEADFRAANRILSASRCVWWSGVGPSAHLAGYAAFLFRRLGKQSGALTHAGFDGADEFLPIVTGDAVVVLAYGRLHRHARVLLDHARGVGAGAVLVTDSVLLPADLPTAARLVGGRGPRGMFASHANTTVLIEALALAMAATLPSAAEASVARLNSLREAISGRPLGVDS